jgi:hypothetical protein
MTGKKAPRISRLEWHKIGDLKTHPRAQRSYDARRAQRMADSFDLEKMGFPIVNVVHTPRAGTVIKWILDGQHRVGGL